MKAGYVYMMASRKNGTIYIGSTSDLTKRAYEHREGLVDGFTRTHGYKHLVWFAVHGDIEAAILHEKGAASEHQPAYARCHSGEGWSP